MTRQEIDQTLREVERVLPTLTRAEKSKVEPAYAIVKLLNAMTLELERTLVHTHGACKGKGCGCCK